MFASLTTTTSIHFVFLFKLKFCNPSGRKITIAVINTRKKQVKDSGDATMKLPFTSCIKSYYLLNVRIVHTHAELCNLCQFSRMSNVLDQNGKNTVLQTGLIEGRCEANVTSNRRKVLELKILRPYVYRANILATLRYGGGRTNHPVWYIKWLS